MGVKALTRGSKGTCVQGLKEIGLMKMKMHPTLYYGDFAFQLQGTGGGALKKGL
jgi:hypothetical protein